MTIGPLTRISYAPSTGTSLTSAPGSGTPMQRASAKSKCALVTAGAVSVAPHEPVTGTGWPFVRTARSPSRWRSAPGRGAAALNISRSREKKRAANAASASSAGTSWAYPAGTLK